MLQHAGRLSALLFAGVAIAGCQSVPVSPPAQGETRVVLPGPKVHDEPRAVSLESLAIPVSPAENRAVSFTNKRSAYYYTQTHRNDHPEHAHFRGLNIAGRRIFSDYQLILAGVALDPQEAAAIVRPDELIRRYPGGLTETLRLFDQQDVVEVELTGAPPGVELRLAGETIRHAGNAGALTFYASTADGASAPTDHVAVGRHGNSFFIAVAPTRAGARESYEQAVAHAPQWTTARRARLEGIIGGDGYLHTSDAQLTLALRWVGLTMDSLVTRQRGDGIYAGLPWFNEYWGRDSFIALPGATLVTGRFEEARVILRSFAQFQELDRTSRFYGRLPNIVKPGSIDYHTTDGTPRWVMALRDYVRYSGDRSLIAELYPNVKASIEGALANWTDASGYLVHADNETWMDARREPDKASYSPRSTRANDIQALWYQQLLAGAEFATAMSDGEAASRWRDVAARLRRNFVRDFIEPATGRIADHLDARGQPDFQLRPNTLFALDMIDDEATAARAIRRAWENLAYPWGVATLDQSDPFFHPYHLAPGRYHKDEAYHNGTVWPWLNGIAMQRLIEFGQAELAWQLFRNTNAIALRRGAVGGLPENLDAYPHPGEREPRLTGTFLQAWSNAEQLRTWYQGVLGIRPDMEQGEILLAPRLPAELGDVQFSSRVGKGRLHCRYERQDGVQQFVFRLQAERATLTLDVAAFEVRAFEAEPGDVLSAAASGSELRVRLVSSDGRQKASVTLPVSAERQQRQRRLDQILAGTAFAQPGLANAHPVMQQSR
jgi:glycogen debranching enzyme